MVAHLDVDISQVWRDYKASPSIELRNQLVEHYLSLVKYNAERITRPLHAPEQRCKRRHRPCDSAACGTNKWRSGCSCSKCQ